MLKHCVLVLLLAACGGGSGHGEAPDAPTDARPPGDAQPVGDAMPDGGAPGCVVRGFPGLPPVPETFLPSSLAVADANKDGRPDLYTTDVGGYRLRLGTADHTFTEGTVAQVGSVFELHAVDVNGDGVADPVMLVDGTPGVQLAPGDGTLGSLARYPVGVFGDRLAIADVDGNGKPDLVLLARSERKLSVLFNQGNGTFGGQRDTQLSTNLHLSALAAGDVTGDGKVDVVLTDEQDNLVYVLDGKADGSFAAPRPFASNGFPQRVAVADLDRDGKLDVIVQGLTSGVGVLRSTGAGLAAHVDYFTGSTATGLAIGDLDGDGVPDVATTDLIAHTVNVLHGNGDGTLADRVLWPAGRSPAAIAIGDATGDGKPDLVIPNGERLKSTFILEGNGDGTFQTERPYPATEPNVVLAADFNKDGILDLATVTARVGVVSVLLGNGDGTFQPKRDSRAAGFARSAVVADFNGDGQLDLAVPDASGNFSEVAVLFGKGDGTFQPPAGFAVGGQPSLVATGDVDGDGGLDLIVYGATNTRTILSVLHGNGNGTFGQHFDLEVPSFAQLMQVADVTGDGHADLVLVVGNTVKVLPGDGHGAFADPVSYATSAFSFGLVIRDLDGDGRLDVLTSNQDATLSLLRSRADGTLAAKVDTRVGPVDTRTNSLALFDATGDGVPDAITVNTDSNALTIVTGNGDGTFGAASHYLVRDEPVQVVAGDFNRDGLADFGMIHIESGGGTVGVTLGRCLR